MSGSTDSICYFYFPSSVFDQAIHIHVLAVIVIVAGNYEAGEDYHAINE